MRLTPRYGTILHGGYNTVTTDLNELAAEIIGAMKRDWRRIVDVWYDERDEQELICIEYRLNRGRSQIFEFIVTFN